MYRIVIFEEEFVESILDQLMIVYIEVYVLVVEVVIFVKKVKKGDVLKVKNIGFKKYCLF